MGSGYIVQRGGGSKPTGTISITENGTVDVTEYASANVNVKDYSAFRALADKSITKVTAEMLDGVTNIGEGAFSGCRALTSVIIPSSVTTIGEMAFDSCTSLSSVTILSGVTSIGNYAFYQCTSLTSVNIPSGVTSIGGGAFYNCRVLASVTVEAVTPPTLGPNAFSNTHSNLVIYVPSESVETYKTTTNWAMYASKIQAIPST